MLDLLRLGEVFRVASFQLKRCHSTASLSLLPNGCHQTLRSNDLVFPYPLIYNESMIATLDTLFAEAMSLTDDARLQLVERLIPTIQSEPSLEAEQVQEVQRRIEEVRSGRVKTIPGAQVFQEIEESLAARRTA